MKRERRMLPTREVRVADDGHTVEAVVLVYNVIDDYNTRFRPGVFAESLAKRMPRITWGHDWRDPIGRWVDYRDTDTELTLIGELDDFDAVPRARQAAAQLASGTIDQFSVGFERLADEQVDPQLVDGRRGVVDIVKGNLDETALVLVGAVPGTKLLAVRSGLVVSEDAVLEMARRVAAGELTVEQGKAALDLLAVQQQPAGDPPLPAEDPPAAGEVEPVSEAELAAASAWLEGDVA